VRPWPLLLSLAACGHAVATPPPSPTVKPVEIAPREAEVTVGGESRHLRFCDRDCLAVRCMPGDHVWRATVQLGQTAPVAIHASSSDTLRVDDGARMLFGVDAATWLACMPGCGSAGNVCVPYYLPMQMSFTVDDGCTATSTSAPKWNGHAATLVTYACGPDVGTIDVTIVPDFAPLRDALVATGVIPADSALAGLEGAPVDIEMEGTPVVRFDDVAEDTCDSLMPPRWHTFDDPTSFATFVDVMPAAYDTMQHTVAATGEAQLRDGLGGHVDNADDVQRDKVDTPLCDALSKPATPAP
jgi:hypothetical protein